MDERGPAELPVAEIVRDRLAVGPGEFALHLSEDWSVGRPAIERALVVLHGRLRDAETYRRSAEAARAAAGARGLRTLLVVPQFLEAVDVAHHRLPPATLRWPSGAWMGGGEALAPAPVGAFAAIDAVLARLADRARFPALREIVVAGHSGGAQVAQRHAVLGLPPQGVALRYVVANPSSYVWFDAERPSPVADCPGYDDWKYGLNRLPEAAAGRDRASLEAAYLARDVTYLLGEADTDPAHPALDRSCMAQAQGPDRRARGLAYVAHLRRRHPEGLAHRLGIVPGVGHDGHAMLTSPPGLRALFGDP